MFHFIKSVPTSSLGNLQERNRNPNQPHKNFCQLFWREIILSPAIIKTRKNMKTKSITNRSVAVLLSTILLLVAIPVTRALAGSSAKYPGTAVTGGGTGSAWSASSGSLVSALGADGGPTANNSLSSYGGSENLNMTGFGFSIPSDATITGISVDMNRYASSTGPQDLTVQLYKGGVLSGSNKAISGNWSTSTSTVATYGGSSDLWGTTWTPAQINDSTFGVTLDVSNSSSSARTAYVDYVQITVSYTRPTTTTVASGSNPSTYGTSVTFTATVNQSAATGTVEFYDGATLLGTGTLNSGTPNIATFSTSALTAATSPHSITAKYLGDTTYVTSTSSALSQTVNKASQSALTAVVTPSTVVYGTTATLSSTGGSGTGVVTFSAGASTGCSVAGTTLSVTNAGGTCSVTATKAADGNYLIAISAAAPVTLEQAASTTTVTGGTFTYDGAAHAAAVSVTGAGGLNLTPAASYSGSCSSAPITVAEGTTCTATYNYAGDINYLPSSNSASITINKAEATINVAPYNVTYNGSAHVAVGTAAGVNGEDLSAGFDLSATSHKDAGTYNGDAWSFSDANYNDASGTVDNFIGKADADCSSITGFNGTYDASEHGVSGSCSGVGGETAGTLDLGATYEDYPGGSAHWSFTGNNNYNDQSGDVTITINKADADCSSVTGFDGAYDATEHGASGSCSGVGGETAGTLDLGATYKDYPGGSAHWSFTGNNNYNDQSGDVAIDISKADASCPIVGFNGAYDATEHGASGSCSGVGGETAGTLDLGVTYKDYPGGLAHWSFTGSNNYNDQSSDVAIDISKADADCSSIAGYSVTYDGASHTATGSCQGLGSDGVLSVLDLSATTHTEVGTYTDAWTFTSSNTNYNDANGTLSDVISAKLVPTVTASGGPFTYDGNQHAANVTSPVAGTVSNVKYNDSATVPSDAGTYAVTADFLPDDTTTYETLIGVSVGSITINKADADCSSIAGFSGPYDGNDHGATGSCLGVNGEDSGTLDLGATYKDYPGGTADWSLVGNNNYKDQSGSVSIAIDKADADCSSIAGYSVTYDGASHTATGSCQGLGSDGVLSVLDLSATTHTEIGTYTDAWTFTSSNVNYNNANGAVGSEIKAVGDTTSPVVNSAVRADADNTNASSVHFTVTFSEVVTGVDVASFNLSTTGVTGASITNVSGSGDTYTVTVNTGSGNGTIRLDVVDDNSIKDAANNPLGGVAAGDGNFSAGETYTIVKSGVNVLVGPTLNGPYPLSSNSSFAKNYPSIVDGPVKVVSTDGSSFFTSQRVTSGDSYNELLGMPANQFTTEYWFPYYDHGYPNVAGSNMRTWILVGNPSTSQTASVNIYIGGALMSGSPFSIAPGSRATPRWIGKQGGPVQVVSTNGVNIFASERMFTSNNNSFSESLGQAVNKLTTEYWFPWYDNVSMKTSIVVGNASTTKSAKVDIYIGGVKKGSYTIAAKGTINRLYAGLVNGPVKVVSTNGVNIVTSENTVSGTNNSFSDVMGYPSNQFTTEYWFPNYDHGYPNVGGSNMRTWILVGNPSTTQTALVQIYIGGVLQHDPNNLSSTTFSIAPGKNVTPRWLGVQGGPVRVVSTNGVNIFTSERVFTVPDSVFNEMMGYPLNQMTTEYWYPWYDSTNMNNDILVSKP
jgi:hypothetical protein